jgi:ribonuclease P protein component
VERANRLTRSIDVKRVRRLGKKIAHPFLLLVTLPNKGKGMRVAFLAGRVIGGAVQRNRAKRVMRAAIQPFADNIRPDVDILVLARPAIRLAKSTKVKEELYKLLKKANLLK